MYCLINIQASVKDAWKYMTVTSLEMAIFIFVRKGNINGPLDLGYVKCPPYKGPTKELLL